MFIIHLTAIVCDAIAHHQVVDMQEHVVDGDLVEHFLCDGDCGGFVLHNHPGFGVHAVEHTVTAEALLPHGELNLIGQHHLGIAHVMGEEVHKMLAHPFLRSQCHVFPAQMVENHAPVIADDDFCVEGREV